MYNSLSWEGETQFLINAQPCKSCVTWGWSLNLSVLRFLNRNSNLIMVISHILWTAPDWIRCLFQWKGRNMWYSSWKWVCSLLTDIERIGKSVSTAQDNWVSQADAAKRAQTYPFVYSHTHTFSYDLSLLKKIYIYI